MRKVSLALAIAALVLAACGSGESADDTPAPGVTSAPGSGSGGGPGGEHAGHGGHSDTQDCSPSGAAVTIVASNATFNTACIAAPANQQWTLTFDNKDSAAGANTHNIVFLESHTATQVMFRADAFQGPATKTFTVPAQKPGTYAFHCEIHPSTMMGTFVVK